jgi:hypothetical protein
MKINGFNKHLSFPPRSHSQGKEIIKCNFFAITYVFSLNPFVFTLHNAGCSPNLYHFDTVNGRKLFGINSASLAPYLLSNREKTTIHINIKSKNSLSPANAIKTINTRAHSHKQNKGSVLIRIVELQKRNRKTFTVCRFQIL